MDEPIEAAYRKRMNELARRLDKEFNGPRGLKPRQIGFFLLIFPFDEANGTGEPKGRANYISNADKFDMLTFFKYQVAQLEGRVQSEGNG